MRTPWTVALVLAALVFGSPGQTRAQDPSAKIVDYGRYKTKVKALKPTEDKVSGSVTVDAEEVSHAETTRKIPCKVGEAFGFRVEYSNLPRDRDYEYRLETDHPAIRQPDGKELTKSVTKTMVKAGTSPGGVEVWHFLKGFEYELVPGKWTMTVFVEGKEVASMSFDVEK